jgi:hypothetical protein
MPSPKKRKFIDDTGTPPPSTVPKKGKGDDDDWKKLLSGAVTPDATSTFISVTHSPFADTPNYETKIEERKTDDVETKTDTPQIDKDGFAIPTPALRSTTNSTLPSITKSTMKTPGVAATPASTIPPNPLSALLSTAISPSINSTRKLTPFTPSGDEIKDVPSVEINYRKLIITAYQVYEEETLAKIEDKQVKTHMNSMLDGMKQKTGARGDKLVIMLKELLDYIPKSYKGWQRSAMQKNFHRNFMQAVCLHLYRDDPDIDMGKIMKMNQFDNLKQQVLCLTPRRFGKTTSVAMFVAAYCLTVPRSEQCIFSTGRR